MADVKAIRFHAAWCGPCRAYKPLWDNTVNELGDKAEFISVDIDKDTEGIAAKYRVQSIPTTVIVKGEEVVKEVGIITEQKLKELILF
jgi:thioredoxin 1